MERGKIMIGCDIVEVKRMEMLTNKKRVFSDEEIKYAEKFPDADTHFAGFYAVKEAVKKSLPDQKLQQQFVFNECSVVHTESGRPNVEFLDKSSFNYSNLCFDITISHTQDIAMAIVVCEKKSGIYYV